MGWLAPQLSGSDSLLGGECPFPGMPKHLPGEQLLMWRFISTSETLFGLRSVFQFLACCSTINNDSDGGLEQEI